MTVKGNLESLRRDVSLENQAYQAAVTDFDTAAAALLGVNATDLRCLEILLTESVPLLPSQLGNQLGLTTGSVTAMLDRLERKGFLTRKPSPDDRRKVLVEPTPRAKEQVLGGIYLPLASEGTSGLERYSAEELRVILTFLRSLRELYERHLARLR